MLLRIGRFLWKFVKWALLVVIALFALAVLINLRDEPLSDEARSLLETKPTEVPDSENIFVAIAGFDAPEGSDIFEAGRSHIEKIKKELEQDPSGLKIAFGNLKEPEGKNDLCWRKVKPPFDCQCCKETDFLTCARSQRNRLEATLTANETLVRRYRLLQELPHYAAPQVPNVWFTTGGGYSLIPKARGALMTQALLDMESGNVKAGLAFFKKDMTFWRRNLEGKSYLLDSMAATVQMTKNVYALSRLLSSPSTNVEGYAPEWRELLTPLSHEQYRMRPAIEGEIRFMYNAILATKRWWSYQEAKDIFCKFIKPDESACLAWQWWLEQNAYAFFIQPNATFNYGVPFFKTWLNLTDLPWKNYIEQRDAALAPFAERAKPGIGWIYNPLGKAQSHFLDLWGEYVGGLHDLDAYLRLVRLQLELRLAKIPSGEIPAFIEHLDEAYCSPCSDFSWNAETRMLSFQPYDKNFSRHASASVYVPEASGKKP